MRSATIYSILIFLMLLAAACEDDAVPRDYPRVRTLPVTNITEEGAVFTAEIYEPGNVDITEHGFVWALSRPDVDQDNRVYLGTFTGTGEFSSEITTTFEPGITYKVSAFVRAGKYTVYGNAVEYTSLGSLGPEITGFFPERVLCGDTILITGKHFSWVKNLNRVIFNETFADICYSVTDTTILLAVPYSLTVPEQTLSVEVAGNRTTFIGKKLLVDVPVMEEINPSSANWGDTVEIKFRNLRPQDNVRIQFGSFLLSPVIAFDGQKLSFVVPWEAAQPENLLKIILSSGEFLAPSPYILLPPVIDSISPPQGVWSDTIQLYGSFNRNKESSTVRFGQFDAPIVYASRDTLIVKVPDNLNTAQADIVYTSRGLSSNPAEFKLDPPEIISVTPMSGCSGTYGIIKCRNLKYPFVSVWLNDTNIGWTALGGYNYEDTFLEYQIKGDFSGPAIFRVTVCGQSDIWDQPFMVTNPYVVSFSPHTGIPGDTINIIAENYTNSQSQLLFGDRMSVLSQNGSSFKVIFPDISLTAGPITAYSYLNGIASRIPSADVLVQMQPQITSVTPVVARYQDEITVRGANFSLIKELNHLTVGGINATITSCTRDELKFTMPMLPAASYEIGLQIGGYKLTAEQHVTALSAWERLPNLPFNNRQSFVMDFDGDVIVAASPEYQSTVTERSIYRYNSETRIFTPTGNSISCIATYFGLVVKGDKAYISRSNGTLPPVLDVFDKNTLTLSKVSDLPVSGGYSYWLMDGDSILLAGLGTTHWKFNPLTGNWTRLNDLPGQTDQGHVFTINGRNFLIAPQSKLYEYNAGEDTWVQKNWTSFPWIYISFCETVVCNNKAYVCFGSVSASIVAYDPVTDSWEKINNILFPAPRELILAFSLGGTLYLGGGQNYYDFWSFNTLWE